MGCGGRLFLLLFMLATVAEAVGQTPTFDVYVNDDGAECPILVALPPELSTKEDPLATRRYVFQALRTQPAKVCDAASKVTAHAILIRERDAYGQPRWQSVKFMGDYTPNLQEIRATTADVSDDRIAQLLASAKR
jgi:hypothetical protein